MLSSLAGVDYLIIGLYVAVVVAIGSHFARRAGRSVESFFVGDRRMTWWLAGTSMVATTFAADTPLAVTGIVASDGIAGNWIWWCLAIAHLIATFFFARMWRRSGVITDAEITELRYSGRPAAALRATKAVYFGLFVNVLTMAWVIAAMVKISRAFFDVEPGWVIVGCILVSVTYTLLGGLRSVVLTDLIQFCLGMGGAVILAWLAVRRFGGIGAPPSAEGPGSGLLGALGAAVETGGGRTLSDVLDFVPPADHPTLPLVYFVVLMIAGWWRYAEGNGYLVQRMAACKNESHAQGAMLWFSVAHNALRPWPWIVVGLASLVVFPMLPNGGPQSRLEELEGGKNGRSWRVRPLTLDVAHGGVLEIEGMEGICRVRIGDQIVEAAGDDVRRTARFSGFPETGTYDLTIGCADTDRGPGRRKETHWTQAIRVELTDREMAYPLMLGRTLPPGLLGLVVASLLAAFMSTIDTHTNWGASYLVQDLYRRFWKPDEAARHYVTISRLCIVLMALLAGTSALFIQNIASVWRFLITLGAGLGSVSAIRWYWSRVTVWSEFAALGVTTFLAIGLEVFCTPTLFGGPNPMFLFPVAPWAKIVIIAGASLATWIPVALWGPQTDDATLRRFAERVRPPGRSWAPYRQAAPDPLASAFQRLAAGLFVTFGTLFGTGDLILGSRVRGAMLLAISAVLLAWVVRSGESDRSDPSPR